MSIINQMLRDLDKRGAASNEQAAASRHPPVQKRGPDARLAAVLSVLVLGGGLAGYWVVANVLNKEPSPAVVAMAPPVAVQEAPAAISEPEPAADTPVEIVEHVAPEPQPVEHVAKPEPAPAELKPVLTVPIASAVPAARPPVTPKLIAPPPARVPGPAPVPVVAEPSVVKKPAELTPEAEAQQLYEDAQALRRAGKVEAAIGKYRLALERHAGMRSARVQLARLLQDSGQTDAAFSLLKAGYEQKPDDGLAIAVGRLLADQGRREDALSWLERGRDGLRPADHALMGALLSQTLRYEAAVKSYQRALAADPNQGGWLLGLGLAQEAMGRIEEAHATYRNALERGEFKPDVIKFLRQKLGMPSL